MELVALYVAAYLLGSIPVGYLFARARGIDITKVGSGNIGATNVMRVLGRGPGIAVLVLDALKGVLACVGGRYFLNQLPVEAPGGLALRDHVALLGAAALIGHTLSPFLRLKGGKGIATGLGALLGSAPIVAATGLGAFLVVLIPSRWVSLASLAAVVGVVTGAVLTHQSALFVALYSLIGLYVVFKHRANIRRLLDGTEPKLGQSRAAAGAATEAAGGGDAGAAP